VHGPILPRPEPPKRDDLAMARRSLHLAGDPDADRLLTEDPLALLIGMVLDQQIPLEKAFRGPADLAQRLGTGLDAAQIAAIDPERLARLFARVPAIHRYPASMAARVQELCRVVVDQYGGDASRIWRDAGDAKDLLARVKALPGFGDHKARIFVALLGKQLGVTPKGWRGVSSPFGDAGATRSVADIVDAASLTRVRQFKQALKAANKGADDDPPRPRPATATRSTRARPRPAAATASPKTPGAKRASTKAGGATTTGARASAKVSAPKAASAGARTAPGRSRAAGRRG